MGKHCLRAIYGFFNELLTSKRNNYITFANEQDIQIIQLSHVEGSCRSWHM